MAEVTAPYLVDPDATDCPTSHDQRNTHRDSQSAADQKDTGASRDGEPKKRNSNYCIQWRTAVATERQAEYSLTSLDLIRLTLAASVIAAFAAGAAAVAAWLTVRTMRETGERELRAYLAGVPGRIVGLTPTEQPFFTFTITNHGQTPARQMDHAVALVLEQYPLPANYPFPGLRPHLQRESTAVLHPESTLAYTAGYRQYASFTAPEIVEILQGHDAGTRRLYAFGQIDYRDIFNRPCWTRFCVVFKGKAALLAHAQAGHWVMVAAGLNGHNGDGTFEASNQHNEMDTN